MFSLYNSTSVKKLKAAFSLIELLVVIAIIAVLASLVTPAIGNAKKNAKTTTCSSNLRQMGVLANTYSTENNGDMVMPFTGHTNSRGDNWTTAFTEMLGLNAVEARTQQNVMHCPTQFEFMVKNLAVNNWRQYTYTQNHQLTSEAFGQSVRNGTTPPPPPAPQVRSNMKPLRTSILSIPGLDDASHKPASPDTVAYFLDGWSRAGSGYVSWRIWHHNGYINGGGPGDLENAFPHDWKSNVVFLDGHVETTTYQEGMWYGAWNPRIWANDRYWDRAQGDYGSGTNIRAF